jgi:23S rRNA maturation mini-RNase III
MTTMQQETAHKLSLEQVRAVFKTQFETVFGIKFISKEPDDLSSILENLTLTDSV